MIHVACLNISDPEGYWYQRLYALASHQRQIRASRCTRREDGLRCLASEALLRYAAKKEGLPSHPVTEPGPQGKPRLRDYPAFHFNLSHSGSWAVIAWGDSEVGIDVEAIRPDRNWERIAQRFFAPEEQQVLLTQPQTFYRLWTAKESYLKYLGTGLATPLNSFSVLSMEDTRFFSLPLAEDYCLTLCTQEDTYRTEVLTWQQLL